MKILKASAGSGKTYTLAHTYLNNLLASNDSYAYRHILAVTFTNKATDEMKERILRELAAEAKGNDKARKMLINMLHDYSAFSISTIDRFFQQALKAFSNEIGQFAAYQVELDKDSLITEAYERVLDGITPQDKDLKEWIRERMMESLADGSKFKIDESLEETGRLVKSEQFRRLKEEHKFDDKAAFDRASLKTLRDLCTSIVKTFEADCLAAANNAIETVSNGTVKRSLNSIIKKLSNGERMPDLSASVMNCPDCAGLVSLVTNGSEDYITASVIRSNIYSLGLYGEILKNYNELLTEKNVLSLDDSADILKSIIDNTDAPFIYEKLGVRYNDFLLDEFQDTSAVQWANFLPLLRESESKGGSNLIVGDVKQSIYRFRDSDWTLLGKEVQRQFPAAVCETMDSNWRSLKKVVGFNNRFFEFVSGKTGTSSIYEGLQQKVRHLESQEGCVRVSFTDNDQQGNPVLSSVQDAVSRGARFSDITILTRNNSDGSSLAAILIENGIPVISDDSLCMSTSSVVIRLISLLGCIANPQNSTSAYVLKKTGIDVPDTYHSLVDLCDLLLGKIKEQDEKLFEKHIVYVEAFMDQLQDWCATNGNKLPEFLAFWKEKPRMIESPQSQDAVRIMTIHKSKGLEFPFVIIPYADKISLTGKSGSVQWAYLDAKTGAFRNHGGLYPVKYDKVLKGSRFRESYEQEMSQRTIDGINLAYVAFTRAVNEMHIIAKTPAQAVMEGRYKDDWKDVSQLLYTFVNADEWISGEPYDFSTLERKTSSFNGVRGCFSNSGRGRKLRTSSDALQFFGPDSSTGVRASGRIRGIVLHKILSLVQTPDTLEPAVKAAVSDGMLDDEMGKDVLEMLSARISAHPQWFVRGRNEASVIDLGGRENRPDRVVMTDGKTIVIDYKFGEEESEKYIRQVERYIQLYRLMGYKNVSGVVWYVPADKVVEVE